MQPPRFPSVPTPVFVLVASDRQAGPASDRVAAVAIPDGRL